MLKETPKTTYLRDYRPPSYLIDKTDLRFELEEEATTVIARVLVRSNPDRRHALEPLVLQGQGLELRSIKLDGRILSPRRYRLEAESLTILQVPQSFTLEIETRIRPQENSSLEGLYKSGDMFCTQCEAEGFRKITYYLDQPDVMAPFTTMILADQDRYPVLLANGNLVDKGELPHNRHWARWEDPFPKPCYLFALVAGNLAYKEAEYVAASGRRICQRIYVEPANLDKCDHAMACLQQAMRWDEKTFGLEYDLDTYMIVAVSDFNMGAMENKGLNIFNTACILAKPETATDADFERIQGVIGHEYFHNWTGNRITCRDWFQLSLKEGLTVFRDQEFSADMNSPAVTRINNVRTLRNAQFPEDDGPMAHAVRPDSYIEISNFYTATVYEKGAEIVSMMQTLFGREGFRNGMDLYIQRHDGQAVTTDDFVQAIADANDADLTQFKLWYSQAGTPELTINGDYDADAKTFTLTVAQSCPPTPGQEQKYPFHIPLTVGLLNRSGQELPLQLEGEDRAFAATTRILDIRQQRERFHFINVPEQPVPSLLRGFSAPVKLRTDSSDADLAFLLAHDRDPFNRWDAGQRLAAKTLLQLIQDRQQGRPLVLHNSLIETMGKTLTNAELDKAFIAEILTLPSETYLADLMDVVDVDAIHHVRIFVRKTLAERLKEELLAVYAANTSREAYKFNATAAGRRSLKNVCLAYLAELNNSSGVDRCMAQFKSAANMTDEIAALRVLADRDCPQRKEALGAFYDKWRHEPLVVDKWFAIQATSRLPETLTTVQQLLEHPDFHIRNPNKVRSLIGAFSRANPMRFHTETGAGYAFLVDRVLALDPLNPQMAARMLTGLARWQRYDPKRQALMKIQLEKVSGTPNLSKDVYEIASKSLA